MSFKLKKKHLILVFRTKDIFFLILGTQALYIYKPRTPQTKYKLTKNMFSLGDLK